MAGKMQKPTVGRIVHVFNREMKDFGPIGIGPYPAIVLFVHEDGSTIEAELFPRSHPVVSTPVWAKAIPFTNGDGNNGRRVWWAWPERV